MLYYHKLEAWVLHLCTQIVRPYRQKGGLESVGMMVSYTRYAVVDQDRRGGALSVIGAPCPYDQPRQGFGATLGCGYVY